MSAVMWVMYVLSLKQILYVVPVLINQTFCVSQKDVLFPKLVVPLKSPEQHFLLLASMPLMSLITPDYNTTLDVPRVKN